MPASPRSSLLAIGHMTTEGQRANGRSRRRGFFVGAVILLVIAVLAILVFTWWLPAYRMDSARASWQPPPQAVLTESMGEQPVPGGGWVLLSWAYLPPTVSLRSVTESGVCGRS